MLGTAQLTHQGRQFGRYTLLYRFASGGMAQIYLGRLTGEDGFERLVALKVIHEHLTDQPQFIKMFIDEARLASRISHPNVVLTLDLGRVGKRHFIAMEYIDGESLAALLRRTQPPRTLAVRIVADTATGLHAAHELRGSDGDLLHVVHRDVSPHNILISYDGAVKVVDFGVARARGRLHTTSGELKGKFSYMAPEQISAPGKVDRRTDVFALGIVLYEATTYHRLFKGDTEAETVRKVINAEFNRPSVVVPDYPADLEEIVLRALAPDPVDRFRTAQELAEALQQFIAASGQSVTGSALGRLMSEVFADRIAEKRDMLHHTFVAPVAADELVPHIEMVQGLGDEGSASILPHRRRGAAWAVILSLAVLGAFAVGIAMVLAFYGLPGVAEQPSEASIGGDGRRGRAEPVTQAGAGDASPVSQLITISVRVQPVNAMLTLDERPVSNPLFLRRPPANDQATLVISATGHETQRLLIPLAEGGTWDIWLDRSTDGKPDQRSKKAEHKRRPPRPPAVSASSERGSTSDKKAKAKAKHVTDEDALFNPYE